MNGRHYYDYVLYFTNHRYYVDICGTSFLACQHNFVIDSALGIYAFAARIACGSRSSTPPPNLGSGPSNNSTPRVPQQSTHQELEAVSIMIPYFNISCIDVRL